MMKAVKENKMYAIDERMKESYLAQGYDILDEKGDVIERSHQAKVPYKEYARVVNELAAMKEELAAMRNVDEKRPENKKKE